MNKFLLYIVCSLLSFSSFSQQSDNGKDIRKKWNDIRERNGYRQSEKYKGPEEPSYDSPSTINENQSNPQGYSNTTTQPYKGIPLSNKDIERGRKTPSNPDGEGGNGTIQSDPNIAPAEEIEVPEIDGPDAPNINGPGLSSSFWYTIGIILLILIIAYIIYQIAKNQRGPIEKAIPFEPLTEDLNPATITKTELELRLEEAMKAGNYKECVRIYFLFAMKDLIEKRWVFWKKEKTNMHYIIEVQGKPAAFDFEQIVKIYDLVWYGDYQIDQVIYQGMQPTLDRSFKNIESKK